MLNATFKAGPPTAARRDATHPLARALAGCWLCNEGRGRTAYDASGHAGHGNFSGDPRWVPSRFGAALAFDGADDWLDMGNRLNLGTDDVTVCAIVKYSAEYQPDNWLGQHCGAIAGRGIVDDSGKGYGLYVNTNNEIAWEVREQSTVCTVTSDSVLNDGRYHTAVGVCDRDHASGLRLYIDGIRQSDTADPTGMEGHELTGSRVFAVGSRQAEDGAWQWDLLGVVACVYVWKRVLCDAEIRMLQCDPFVLFARRRRFAALGAPLGQVVELAGSTAGQSTASGTLRILRHMSGSVGAVASLSAVMRNVRTLAGDCGAKANLIGALSTTKVVSLSGAAHAASQLTGFLRVPFSRPVYGGTPPDKPFWLCEALFNGATATGARLGTVLTQGWFWVRRPGCAAVYRGPSTADVDFENVLCVAEPDTKQISLPTYLSHDPASRHYYVVRKFDGCGYAEQTQAAAVVIQIGPNGRVIQPGPNGIFHLNCRRTGDDRLCLSWFYCPLGQNAAPEKFYMYRGDDVGQIDMEQPAAVVPYQGRRFYRCYADGCGAGKQAFVVQAVSADDLGSASVPPVCCEAAYQPPPAPTVLATELV